jgi:MinD-like ATPase involved in chromosome partitioning or flagellar assembly
VEDRRRPARPPWLLSGDVQPRVSPWQWPQHDEADAYSRPSYPPMSTPPDDYPQQDDEVAAENVAADQQQAFDGYSPDGYRPTDDYFPIDGPPDSEQPVDATSEPLNASWLSDVNGYDYQPAVFDPEPGPSSVSETTEPQLLPEPDQFPPGPDQFPPDPDQFSSVPDQFSPDTDQFPPEQDSAAQPTAEPQLPSARGIGLPPWTTPTSVTRGDVHQRTFPREPPAGRPFAVPRDESTGETPRPQQFGFPPPGVPPPPPPGWVPGSVPPPPWWPPPVPSGWPPVPPGGPPPADRQQRRADGAELPRTPVPPAVPVFRIPPSLDEAEVVDSRKYAPQSGWRRAVHRATRGHVNPGDSRKDRAKEYLFAQIGQPIAGDFRIAVLSVKGGVGKTTTTLGLGSALAMVRGDRVIAVDANPDRGTLAERVRDTSTRSTVRDLLMDPNINGYADIRSHTRMAVSRLEVLASEQDPAAAEVFNEADYRRTIQILGHNYNVILTDCGTGIMHSAMAGVLDLAHSIVLVSSPTIDAVRSLSATVDWLMQHGHSGLVREGHVVLSSIRPRSPRLRLDKVCEFFETRCRSIHFIPFDPHLAEGADVDFGLLRPTTRQAYLELASAVAENFPRLRSDRI